MSEESIGPTNPLDSTDVVALGRLFQHLREPQNLLTYLVFSAWLKFMGISTYIPSITIG